MTQISNRHLEFVQQAKMFFERSEEHYTFRDEDEGLIALREGLGRDCIEVFELGERVANFVQQIEVKGDR